MLHEVGVDSDVACYDYTHIMGCPEWEDADFTGDVGNHFQPSWNAVRLRGFRRPEWFSQGPFSLALGYLEARRTGHTLRAATARRLMNACRAIAAGPRGRGLVSAGRRAARWFNHWILHPGRRRRLPRQLARVVLIRLHITGRVLTLTLLRVGRVTRPPRPSESLRGDYRLPDCRIRRDAARSLAHRWLGRRGIALIRPLRPVLLPLARGLCRTGEWLALVILGVGAAIGRVTGGSPRLIRRASRATLGLLVRGLLWTGRRLSVSSPLEPPEEAEPSRRTPRDDDRYDFDARVAELIAAWDEAFPDRPDRFTAADAEPYRHAIRQWRKLFRHYDVIEAYSTDPILTMLAGDVPYVAYEHGTIRDIPFMDSPTGRLTALAYRLADAVIITNPDCREAADRLGIERYRFVPHLIDRKYSDPVIASGPMPEGIHGTYIFCPARHDFDVKGSDILIRAFARFAADHPDVSLVMTRWGADLERSLALADELGIRDRMVLAGPFHIHDLIRVTAGARVLVDQFCFGVFGGIGPTALACGTPLITRLDHEKSAWCMERAPVWDARDVDSCLQALRDVFAGDPDEQRRSLREWMERNYWHGDVTTRHVDLLLDAVERRAAAPETASAPAAGPASGDVPPTPAPRPPVGVDPARPSPVGG